MAKLAQNFAKYVIKLRINAKGIVERPDIIGAIFGQTEGLLGSDLDLRELQHTGRIGRIEVDVKANKGRASAEVVIPSSLDASETSLIAASMETIDKIGPCDAEVEIISVEDVRSQKRQYVVERAKEILRSLMDQGMPESQKISEMVKESVRSWEVVNYCGLSAGPDVLSSEEIIIVEGRADVINLLKNGIRNVIAIEGSRIPQEVADLTKGKTTTAFLDGDRGGDLDLKKLLAVAEIDFVARAPPGKEVEELSRKEIFKSLRDKVPINQTNPEKSVPLENAEPPEMKNDEKEREFFASVLEGLVGTRAACIIDRDMQVLGKVPISEIGEMLDNFSGVFAIVFDGKINQLVVDMANKRRISYVVGMGFKERVRSVGTRLLTMRDLKPGSEDPQMYSEAINPGA
ncbi:MAG: DNA primase [Candidatus Aenigmarchaeota archaeon]|nr:DNA primase [Candidatus Aenigmarchaeota archaeon]